MSTIIFPDYDRSLLSITSSVLKNYNVNLGYKTLEYLDNILNRNYRNVIFYLIDAMGSEILNKHHQESKFLINNRVDNLTTVFPSTTVAATTTAITGLPPVVSGWLGWQQYVHEEDKNVIFFLNKDYYNEEYKFNYNVSNKYTSLRYIYDLITCSNKDVLTHEIFPEFRIKEHKTIQNQVNTIIKTIDNNNKNFIYAYWDKLDVFLHEYGTKSSIVSKHISEIDNALETLYNSISDDTLVIVTADHGQVDVENINLWEYEDLMSMLLHKPALEGRATAFYVKDGFFKKFEETFNNHFKNKFILYNSNDILKMNILGKGQISPRTKGFLGDYLAIAIDKYSFNFQKGSHVHKASHAGFLKDEMMIPLIILNKRLSD